MRKISLTLIAVLVAFTMIGNAQNGDFFEGDMLYRNFENHNKAVMNLSKGMAYNGARTVRIIMKGYNIHIIDEVLHIHILLLPDENKAIIYNDLLKKGQEFPFWLYVNTYIAVFSPEARVIAHNITLPAPKYTIASTGEKKEYMGQTCDIYKGQVIVSHGATDVELWVSSKHSIYKSYWYFLNGIQVPGIVLKWTYDQKADIPLIGKLASFVASEVKEINERIVANDEMQVPSDIKIVVSESPFKVVSLYKETVKYLTKNKMFPNQQETEVTFRIEEDWDF